MFVPQPTNAQAFLKDRKDPPVAVFWWPRRSYASCDGTVAVNTGPWVREWGKAVGYFTTVWKRQPDGGWKWVYDAGDELKAARPEGGDVKPVAASCGGTRTAPRGYGVPGTFVGPVKYGSGISNDQTLAWTWAVDSRGARQFVVQQWTGKDWTIVVHDRSAAASE